MRLSVDLGKFGASENGIKPKVGVVIVRNGVILGRSFRGETGEGRHAEFGLIDQLDKAALLGATVFTTLEPCSRRGPGKQPCASHIIESGIEAVYIGMYDPSPTIYREGWKMLRDAGLTLHDYPDHLRLEIEADNRRFIGTFKISIGESGSAAFDYHQNGGRYELQSDDISISTSWQEASGNAIWAVDHTNHTALARYARELSEIDNPGALDWTIYTLQVRVGEIVAFRTTNGYALVKITDIFAGEKWGHDHIALHFDYEVRKKETIAE